MTLKFKDIIKQMFIRKKDCCYHKQLDQIGPKANLQYNVYEAGPTMGEYVKQMFQIHIRFKKWIVYPFIWFCQRVIGKYLVKDVPKTPHFKNLRIFNEAMEESFKDWCWYYQCYKYKGQEVKEEDFEKCMNSDPIPMLRSMKEFLLTVVKNDTAYIEFMNFLMFNIAKKMGEEYPSDPIHITYSSNNISDVTYFIATRAHEGVSLSEIRKRSENGAKPIETKL